MAGKPAATVGSSVAHPAPPVLTGAGSFTVLINNKPAWRGMPVGGGAGGGGGGFDTSAISGSSTSMLQEKKDATKQAKALGEDSDEYKEAVDAEAAANEMVGGIMDSLSSGLGGGLVQVLQSAKKASDAVLKSLKATATAAVGPAKPIAEAAEKAGQIMAATMMGTMIAGMAASSVNPMTGGMPDIHTCTTPLPLPPHGPGMVIDGSSTVLIQGMPAAKVGCTIVEAVGPPNKITSGSFNVMIGG